MEDTRHKAARKRDQCEARIDIDEPMEQREPKGCSHPLGRVATEEGESQREQARTHRVQMMMLDIDGVLTQFEATPTDVLAAAQAIATAAIGDLTNRGVPPAKAHPLADAIAEQIREALHKRIDEGVRSDW